MNRQGIEATERVAFGGRGDGARHSAHGGKHQLDRGVPRRLAGDATDRQIADWLINEKFGGRQSEVIIEGFVEHASSILHRFIYSGEIFGLTAGLGRPAGGSRAWLDIERSYELAFESVAQGVELFKAALLRRDWDPTGDASLRTYFVNACILCFPNVFRKAEIQERNWNADPVDSADLVGTLAFRPDQSRGPATSANERDWLNRLLADVPPDMRQVLLYIAEGYTYREIAPALGTTHRAVESKMRRFRERLREMDQLHIA